MQSVTGVCRSAMVGVGSGKQRVQPRRRWGLTVAAAAACAPVSLQCPTPWQVRERDAFLSLHHYLCLAPTLPPCLQWRTLGRGGSWTCPASCAPPATESGFSSGLPPLVSTCVGRLHRTSRHCCCQGTYAAGGIGTRSTDETLHALHSPVQPLLAD